MAFTKKILFIALLILFHSNTTVSAQWESTFGGNEDEYAQKVIQTSDGGFIVVGSTKSFGVSERDIYMVKTDSTGGLEWNRTYGGDGDDYGYAVIETSEGNFIVTGYTDSLFPTSKGHFDVFLFQVNSTGEMMWNTTIGGGYNDRVHDMAVLPYGDLLLAGWSNSNISRKTDDNLYLVKTDSEGNDLWNKTYGGIDAEMGFSCTLADDGGVVIAGMTNSYGAGGEDAYLVKVDSDGNMVWNRTYGGAKADWAMSVVKHSQGGYLIGGYTESYSSDNTDFYIVKTDKVGNIIWEKSFNGSYQDYGYSIIETFDEGCMLLGFGNPGRGDSDIYVIKVDVNGNKLWEKTFGGDWGDNAFSIIEIADNEYVIAGNIGSLDSDGYDFYLTKINVSNYNRIDQDPNSLNETDTTKEPSNNESIENEPTDLEDIKPEKQIEIPSYPLPSILVSFLVLIIHYKIKNI